MLHASHQGAVFLAMSQVRIYSSTLGTMRQDMKVPFQSDIQVCTLQHQEHSLEDAKMSQIPTTFCAEKEKKVSFITDDLRRICVEHVDRCDNNRI